MWRLPTSNMSSRLLCNLVRVEFNVRGRLFLAPCIRHKSVGRPVDVTLPHGIKHALDTAGKEDSHEVAKKLRKGEPLYPHNDTTIFWRSCHQEVVEPLSGVTTGKIPQWLEGTLLRNGPGLSQIGEDKFHHWFDGPAMVHRFGIADGKATYQCRFLQTSSYRKNMAAGRIVCSEFGTGVPPDPCRTIFHRVFALFSPGDNFTDNAMISVYPFGDDYYCFTESPVIHRVDPISLETLDRVDVTKHVSVMSQTSHPHVTEDGSVYNQTMQMGPLGPSYSVVKFPASGKKSQEMFDLAEVVASVRARWPLHPSYMHTFGLTDNFYVIVEQPLTLSVPTMVKSQLKGDEKLTACFKYFPDEQSLFHVVERATGNIFKTFTCEPFFFFHIVNQFEKDDHLVIDICCYSDGDMIDALYREAMENMNKNPDYARLFRGRPLRFVLPLTPPVADNNTNLVTLTGSSATAFWKNGKVSVRPELLCDLGCEMPRINYDRHLGRPYRYFYAISSDVDADNPGTLIKVDTEGRTAETWRETGVFPSEPVFVPSPQAKTEDDGVILSSLLWGKGLENQVGLVVLDAATMQELGRTVFKTPSAVPKDLHGWFTSNTKVFIT